MRFCPNCEREFDDTTDVCPDDGDKLVFIREEVDPLIGRTVDGRYQVLERIGEGGMGSVYRAKQMPVGREIALKVLRRDLSDDAAAVRRFFHEAKVVSKLRHPNTVTLYDFGQSDDGLLFIAMELMTGFSLDRIAKSGGFGLEEIVEVGIQICQALAEAHELDIVHRDLKPSNIFVDEVGARKLVKILDFGIAKIKDVGSNLTLTGMVFGTPAYMSPEQAQGLDIDGRTDLYALGVLLFELVTGRLPYPGDSPMKIAMAHILQPIPDPEELSLFKPLPPALTHLIRKMLAKEPDHRPPSSQVVRRELVEVGKYLTEHPAHPFAPTIPDASDSGVSALGAVAAAGEPLIAVRERIPETGPTVGSPAATGPQAVQEVYETNPQPEVQPDKITEVIDVPEAIPPSAVTKVMEAPPPAPERSSAFLGYGILLALGSLTALIVLFLIRFGGDDNEGPVVVEPTDGAEASSRGDETITTGTDEANEAHEAAEASFSTELLSPIHDAVSVAERTAANVAAVSPPQSTRISTEPTNAQIVRVSDGVTLCERTPCVIELPIGDDSILIEARRRRYRRQRLEVRRGDTEEVVITLERRTSRGDPDHDSGTSRFMPIVSGSDDNDSSDIPRVDTFPDEPDESESTGSEIGPLMDPVYIDP